MLKKFVISSLLCLSVLCFSVGPAPAAFYSYDIDDVTLEPQAIFSTTLTWEDFGLPGGQVITGDPVIFLDYAISTEESPGIIMWSVDSDSGWFKITAENNSVELGFKAGDFNTDRELFTHASSFASEWTVTGFRIQAEVVPIPSTLLLLAGGLAGLLGLRRRVMR